jgi:hypothetical protein
LSWKIFYQETSDMTRSDTAEDRPASAKRFAGASQRRVMVVALALAVRLGILACPASAGQSSAPSAQSPSSAHSQGQDVSPLSLPPRAWALDAVACEVRGVEHANSYLRYRAHQINERGDRVREQIETKDGTVSRLILRDGRPLTAEEDAAERARLNNMLTSPSAFYRHARDDQSDRKMSIRLLGMLPDAMIYSYAPDQPQLPTQPLGRDAIPLVVLAFKPNPNWSPPNLESEVLTGVEGRVWIEPRSRCVVRVESDLSQPVNIGLGVLAHLYPPGNAQLQQTNVPNTDQTGPATQRWMIEHLTMQFNLRALMVRDIHDHLVYDTSDFQVVPAMTYQEGIKLLLATPSPTH